MSVNKIICIIISIFNGVLIGSCQSKIQEPHCKNVLFNSLVKSSISGSIPTIDVEQLFKDGDKYLILDARELSEYQVSHINGAIHIGYENPDFKKLQYVEKNQAIAVYCSIGYRSEKIAEHIKASGYKHVVNVHGSIFEWVNRGYPLIDSNYKETYNIHGYSRSWGIWIKNNKYKVVYN